MKWDLANTEAANRQFRNMIAAGAVLTCERQAAGCQEAERQRRRLSFTA